MSRLTALIPAILLALTIAAEHSRAGDAVTTVPFSRHFNLDDASRIVDKDQARARALRSQGTRTTDPFSANHILNSPITNALVIYLADVDIGTPPTRCKQVPAMHLRSRIAEMSVEVYRSTNSRYRQLEHLGRSPMHPSCNSGSDILDQIGAGTAYVPTRSSVRTHNNVVCY